MNWIEIVGLLASFMIFVSFIFKDIKRVRIFNIIGSLIFMFYGLQINALSVVVLNFGAVFVNLYHLRKMKHGKETSDC